MSLAETCRRAGLSFLEGPAADWWGKAELVAWLEGPYKEATRWSRAAPLRANGTPSLRRSRPPGPPANDDELVRVERIEAVMREARWHVLASLESLASPSGSRAWVERALARGYVVPRSDAEGNATWAPADLRTMRLRDRVESLFAADHLTRPRDYALELIVCHLCEAVVFDQEARERGDCGAHGGTEYDWDQTSRIRKIPRLLRGGEI
jgi:hypothetical protein